MNLRHWCKRKIVWLYIKILREKGTPESIARGWSIGMFCGCLIPFGLQLLISIPLAFLLKGSKLGATLGTFVTNHFTILLIYPAQCYVGNLLIGGTLSWENIHAVFSERIADLNWESLTALGTDFVVSFFLGGAVLTAIMTPLTYFAVRNLVRKYRAAKRKHSKEEIL